MSSSCATRWKSSSEEDLCKTPAPLSVCLAQIHDYIAHRKKKLNIEASLTIFSLPPSVAQVYGSIRLNRTTEAAHRELECKKWGYGSCDGNITHAISAPAVRLCACSTGRLAWHECCGDCRGFTRSGVQLCILLFLLKSLLDTFWLSSHDTFVTTLHI